MQCKIVQQCNVVQSSAMLRNTVVIPVYCLELDRVQCITVQYRLENLITIHCRSQRLVHYKQDKIITLFISAFPPIADARCCGPGRYPVEYIPPLVGEGEMPLFDLSYWHATTKTYAYFGVFGFFRIIFFAKKVTLPWSNHIFEIQWEIHFLKRPFSRQNAPKKFQNNNCIGLCVKTAFENNFGPPAVPKLENLHFQCHAFSGWGTSQGPKLFPKAFITQSPI